MILPETDHQGTPVPAGTAFTKIVNQRILDECARALDRLLLPHEVKVLDDMLVLLRKQNQKKWKAAKITAMHSTDEIVSLFIDRVKVGSMLRFADKVMRNN